MAKIDVTKIPNFDALPEDVRAALSSYEVEDVKADLTGYVKKDVLDAKAREAAELSRKLKEKMTEDERKEADRAASEAAIKAELESLRRDKTVSESKAKYLGLGYDEKLASETAKALADGDMERVFSNQAIHLENVKKAASASALAGDPKPPAGSGEDAKIDYQKKIQEAQAAGSIAEAAYYIRMEQQEHTQNT